MIKSFERYTKKQVFSGGFAQWQKRYDDGQTALVCVDDNCTRALVRSAFEAQENADRFGAVFTKSNASDLGYKY